MKYTITHTTAYTYGSEVLLNPHLLRLCPRNDGFQRLLHHSLTLSPTPKGQTTLLDAEGNLIQRCWWAEEGISALEIQAISEVETLCDNPFAYLLEPWAMHCPIDYPASLRVHLEPYLNPHHLGSLTFDPVAVQLAHEIAHSVDWNTLNFLSELNQRIYGQLTYQVREVGDPLPPQITWQQQSGSCRDFVVLFMAVCRAVGLAARFVSGYEAGDPAYEQVLHAWVEVYLPGAGWRGYDPTMGLAVSDRHVAIAASGWPRQAAPITGSHQGAKGGAAILRSQISMVPHTTAECS